MANEQRTACLILIGNELLSGRTQDKNLAYIGEGLNRHGVRLIEARVIPDLKETIADTVNECRQKYDFVFTTGGIGPTHDDITAESVPWPIPTEIVSPRHHDSLKRSSFHSFEGKIAVVSS